MRGKNRTYNPFRAIPIVDPKEVLDSAIKKALSLSPPKVKKNGLKRAKIAILNRIQYICDILVSKFSLIINATPNLNRLDKFYLSILNVYSDVNVFKRLLGRISGSIKVIKKLSNEYKKAVRSINSSPYLHEKVAIKQVHRLWRQYLARISSFIEKIEDAFKNLGSIITRLKKLPDYNPELKTIVVCGPPNSGKSSLVGALSNARVEIAEYPFTTKNLIFGHISLDTVPPIVLQIVDSPGLFDRPVDRRKKEELLALEAIRTIANCIVFLFDCSHERTLDLKQQVRIFETVKGFFRGEKIIVAINKVDVNDEEFAKRALDYLNARDMRPIFISAKYKLGLDKLLIEIKKYLVG